MEQSTKNIFGYLDYREFLKKRFEELKEKRKGFSYRAFSRLTGFSASNFLMLVMQGKRNLSSEGIQKVAKGLKLKKDEVEFFENLVRFNQSTHDEERNFYYGRIATDRKYVNAKKIEKSHYEYYSKWYHVAIRELATIESFSADPNWIAKHLSPPITTKEAGESLELLQKLGFLKRDEKGRLVQSDSYLETEDEVMSLAVSNFHREMITRGAESIDRTPGESREISSITFGISKERMKRAKQMIQEFRKTLSAFLAEEDAAETIYQLNFQLFNLSKLPEDWK